MVSNHGKKSRAKKRARRTGAGHQPSITNTLHTHEPLPDVTILPLVPHGSGRVLDLDLAARLVAACRAGCGPCRKSLANKVVTESRSTLAALAQTVYGPLRSTGFAASAPTVVWAPLARAAVQAGPGHDEAFAPVDGMDEASAAALLVDTLGHWAAGGPVRLGDLVGLATGAPPRRRPTDPIDTFGEAGVEVVTLDDVDLGDDVDTYDLFPNYGVMPMETAANGRPMPMLLLHPETDGAGIEDLEARTDWEHWGLHGMPDMDSRWRVRARIADRSLRGLVRIGQDGEDDVELWRAAESVTLPQDWWDLLDRAQHILVVGPVTDPEAPGALEAAADAGELLAVLARVIFR